MLRMPARMDGPTSRISFRATISNERDLREDELNDPNVIKGTVTVRNVGAVPMDGG